MRRIVLLSIITLTITACAATTPPPITPRPSATPTPAPPPTTPTLAPTPTPAVLYVCSRESQIASPFAPTAVGNDLLTLFYEPPIEYVGYRWEPRLVDHVPSPQTGDVLTETITVHAGMRYADTAGGIYTYTKATPTSMPRLIVTFTLKSDLHWSDGQPLTAKDVVFGYHLAQVQTLPGQWRTLVQYTARFTALDEHTLRWEGIPGYLSSDYPGFIFPPQPQHHWQGRSLEDIFSDRTPPATGPFEITAWEIGREIRLKPNLYYAGPPAKLDEIIVRFVKETGDALPALLTNGTCDVMLPNLVMHTSHQMWDDLATQGKATIWANIEPTVLRLDFNTAPADHHHTPLADLKVRQAIASCVNRQKLASIMPGEALLPAESFIPPGHPAYDSYTLNSIPHDLQAGQSLLDEAGWKDEDNDGIREAHNVAGIRNGTPLSLSLYLTPQYIAIAAHIAADLEQCGIGVSPRPTEAQLLYASDGVSPLFKRRFDLALFGWYVQLPKVCGAWLSNRIPNEDNHWQGENFSGYNSPEYDRACKQALRSINLPTQYAALHDAQQILTADLPTLFLVWRPYWFVARPQVQGLQPDATATGALWNVEKIALQSTVTP